MQGEGDRTVSGTLRITNRIVSRGKGQDGVYNKQEIADTKGLF